jgi:hypothetical protein
MLKQVTGREGQSRQNIFALLPRLIPPIIPDRIRENGLLLTHEEQFLISRVKTLLCPLNNHRSTHFLLSLDNSDEFG